MSFSYVFIFVTSQASRDPSIHIAEKLGMACHWVNGIYSRHFAATIVYFLAVMQETFGALFTCEMKDNEYTVAPAILCSPCLYIYYTYRLVHDSRQWWQMFPPVRDGWNDHADLIVHRVSRSLHKPSLKLYPDSLTHYCTMCTLQHATLRID